MNLAAQGRFPEAEQVLRAAEKKHPNEFEARYRLGVILLRQGKAREATTRFEAAAEISRNSALPWLGLAQSRLKQGQRDAAHQAAKRAAELGNEQPSVWRALALFYAESNEFARAAEFEERWGATPEADPESMLRLCRLRVLAGDGKRAVEVCRRAIAQRESADLQQLLGDAYRLAGHAAAAVEAYQRAIHLNPAESKTYFSLVALFLDHRTPLPAIAVLGTAIAKFPKETEFRRMLGLAQYQTGDFDKAIEAFLAAIDLDPDAETSYASLETLIPQAGPRLPEIVERLRHFRARRPGSPVGHFLIARALAVGATAPEAEVESLLRQAVQVEPGFWPAHFELAQRLETQGHSSQAIQTLERVVKLKPDYAPAHYSLAQLYGQAGDRLRAVEHRKQHHALLHRERARLERARTETPTLQFKIEAPGRSPTGPP
jgi:tetratricopeptide (TPR) repeat protein